MTAEEKSFEEWLAEERARLDKGFSYEPQPSAETEEAGSSDDLLAELGFGAGVVGGVVAGHRNPVTFEGCRATTIVSALRSEIAGDDTRLEIDRTEESVVVTILQGQDDRPRRFLPALTVTLIEAGGTLAVAMSDLSEDAKRDTIGSIGRTALRQSGRLLLRRRGLAGMLNAAGSLMKGVEDVSEGLHDLSLPRRVWAVIDRVGGAAEEAYLEERRRRRALERKREAAERAWTHCEWCGRAYAEGGEDVMICPSCGAPRGVKPDWMA